jgi:hypothetical protein
MVVHVARRMDRLKRKGIAKSRIDSSLLVHYDLEAEMADKKKKPEKLLIHPFPSDDEMPEVYLALAKHFGIPDDDPRVIEAKDEIAKRDKGMGGVAPAQD